MEVIKVKIEEIIPYKNNAKLHPQEQIEQIKKSILEFGNNDPIAIDENNVIIEGNGRYKALTQLGYTEVDCIRLEHLTEEQKKAYILIHNQLTMNTGFDIEMLNLELASIENIDMSEFDFEIDFDADDEPVEIVEDEVPDVDDAEPITKLGDIWQLGRHRLMCGSSTSEKDVAKLMMGEKAKMLFTSPPYSDMREYNGGKDLSVDNIATFISKYKPFTDYQCVNLGIQRKDHEIVQYWDEYIRTAQNSGYKLMAWNVWDKSKCGSIGNQSAFFPIRHEWIFVFGTEFFEINLTWDKAKESIKQGNHERRVRQADGRMEVSTTGDLSNPKKQMESVVQILPEQSAIIKEHPATFPVKLPSEYILAMSDKCDNVIEPFGGSGTTLIACEQLDRTCYMMELDPKYCDVIIKRWETLTGEKAELISR
jgi:site-specific DNA-methyltransferase (adenine-specific)